MEDRNSRRQQEPFHGDARQQARRHHTEAYYRPSHELGESRSRQEYELDDQDLYDDFYSGKRENYKGQGYYGSNYGSITEGNRGRNYESNAGYRDQYRRLTEDQWPEVEEAAQRRRFDLRGYELRERGFFKGKGPRGYQRSDMRIREDVNDVLLEDPYIDASGIDVSVENGEVILTGEVENRNIKRRVDDIIEEQVSGIRHMENRLHVRHNRQITTAVNSRQQRRE